ncbi:MAG: hypothetical protein KF773_19205 [Deltaproteobacteria bacterium]|nr:hypothetical protein [Deltaproteobacteria bacterium]MCW5804932.1 hypothetical protein [Deltaproteobacteria bacterium]
MRLVLLCLVAVVGCGGGATFHNLTIVNQTARKIDEVYVHAPNADKGASRGALAQGASLSVKVKGGGVEVLGISELVYVDQKVRDRPSASQVVEVTSPTSVVFYDLGKEPPGLDRPGIFGVAFRLLKPAAPEGEPSE